MRRSRPVTNYPEIWERSAGERKLPGILFFLFYFMILPIRGTSGLKAEATMTTTTYILNGITRSGHTRYSKTYASFSAMVNDAHQNDLIQTWFNDDNVDFIQPCVYQKHTGMTKLKPIRRRFK